MTVPPGALPGSALGVNLPDNIAHQVTQDTSYRSIRSEVVNCQYQAVPILHGEADEALPVAARKDIIYR